MGARWMGGAGPSVKARGLAQISCLPQIKDRERVIEGPETMAALGAHKDRVTWSKHGWRVTLEGEFRAARQDHINLFGFVPMGRVDDLRPHTPIPARTRSLRKGPRLPITSAKP